MGCVSQKGKPKDKIQSPRQKGPPKLERKMVDPKDKLNKTAHQKFHHKAEQKGTPKWQTEIADQKGTPK